MNEREQIEIMTGRIETLVREKRRLQREIGDGREDAAENVLSAPGHTPGRPSAHYRLRDKIAELRFKADDLQALLDSLPRVLPPEADEALWELLGGDQCQ